MDRPTRTASSGTLAEAVSYSAPWRRSNAKPALGGGGGCMNAADRRPSHQPPPPSLPHFRSAAPATRPQPSRVDAVSSSAVSQRRWSNNLSAMSSPAPSTPEHAPPASSNLNGRRSFTLPARITNRPTPQPVSTNSSDGIETLFTSASTKIVSFTATASTQQVTASRRTTAEAAAPEPIPWGSVTERTLAVGVLRIYRVTSSNVSFLNSGNLLHTIFPRSQCWCVDGESKYVLRIRQDSYYRIELPVATPEEQQKTEEFKAVLSQVLQFEKTRCPFRRGFEVELPERPKTPPRRQPNKVPPGKAKKWLFDKTWVPENGPRPSTPILEGSDSGTMSSYEDDDRSSINTESNEAVPESPVAVVLDVTSSPKPAPPPSVLERTKTFQGMRSVTAPSGLAPAPMISRSQSDLPPVLENEALPLSKEDEPTKPAETLSLMSSTDSFYSLESPSLESPSPPFWDAEVDPMNPWMEELGKQEAVEHRGRVRHRRQISEATLRAQSSDSGLPSSPRTPTIEVHAASSPTGNLHLSSPPSTPPLISDSDEDSLEPPLLDVPTPPDNIRMRRLTGATQRRAFSPMPQPQNLFRPAAPGAAKALTSALVRRTCEILLGPPAHLVSLMLRIAAKISNFGFNTYRIQATEQKLPCSWESSDEDEWDEDDFGIPLGNVDGSSLRRREFSGEVD